MKKLLPIFIVLSVIAFVSCKKKDHNGSYHCECTYTPINDTSNLPDKVETTTITSANQNDAESQCDGLMGEYEADGYEEGNCELE